MPADLWPLLNFTNDVMYWVQILAVSESVRNVYGSQKLFIQRERKKERRGRSRTGHIRCIHNKARSSPLCAVDLRTPTRAHSTHHQSTPCLSHVSVNQPAQKARHFLAHYYGMSFLFALILLCIHFVESLWFPWISCNAASACKVSIKQQQQQQQGQKWLWKVRPQVLLILTSVDSGGPPSQPWNISRLDVAAKWADSSGMLFSLEKSEHLHIGKVTGQRVTTDEGCPYPRGQTPPSSVISLQWITSYYGLSTSKTCACTELVYVWLVFCADCVGDFKELQSRQFLSVPFHHVLNMRLKFEVEDQRKAYKDYNIHFPRGMAFTCLHYRIDLTITLWFRSTKWDQL